LKVLARTWNKNASGVLWEALWFYQEGASFGRRLIAPGVYAPDTIFENEENFWAAYESERQQFFGERING